MKETKQTEKEELVLVNFRITKAQRAFIKKVADEFRGESAFIRYLLEKFIIKSNKK